MIIQLTKKTYISKLLREGKRIVEGGQVFEGVELHLNAPTKSLSEEIHQYHIELLDK